MHVAEVACLFFFTGSWRGRHVAVCPIVGESTFTHRFQPCLETSHSRDNMLPLSTELMILKVGWLYWSLLPRITASPGVTFPSILLFSYSLSVCFSNRSFPLSLINEFINNKIISWVICCAIIYPQVHSFWRSKWTVGVHWKDSDLYFLGSSKLQTDDDDQIRFLGKLHQQRHKERIWKCYFYSGSRSQSCITAGRAFSLWLANSGSISAPHVSLSIVTWEQCQK